MLLVAAAVGSGLMAGVFFAFSAFVMTALKHLPPPEGLAAMQSINVAVINPLFLSLFLVTPILCLMIIISAVSHWTVASPYLLVGSSVYLVGSFFVTLACNVPLNNALAKLQQHDTGTTEFWPEYVKRWTRWNHVRTLASTIACLAFVLANIC